MRMVVWDESKSVVCLLWWVLIHPKIISLVIWVEWVLEEVRVAYERVQWVAIWAVHYTVLLTGLRRVQPLKPRHRIIDADDVATVPLLCFVLDKEVLTWFLGVVDPVLAHLLDEAELPPFVHAHGVLARAIHQLYLCPLCLCRLLGGMMSGYSGTLFHVQFIAPTTIHLAGPILCLGVTHLGLVGWLYLGLPGCNLAWLANSNAFARLCDFDSVSHLTSNHNVLFQ